MISASMTPQQYVQDKAAASGSSFYYAFLFLPQPRRAAITAFYAFCRERAVVDEFIDPGSRRSSSVVSAEVAQAFTARPQPRCGTDALAAATASSGPSRRHRRLQIALGQTPFSTSLDFGTTAIWLLGRGEVAATLSPNRRATIEYPAALAGCL